MDGECSDHQSDGDDILHDGEGGDDPSGHDPVENGDQVVGDQQREQEGDADREECVQEQLVVHLRLRGSHQLLRVYDPYLLKNPGKLRLI